MTSLQPNAKPKDMKAAEKEFGSTIANVGSKIADSKPAEMVSKSVGSVSEWTNNVMKGTGKKVDGAAVAVSLKEAIDKGIKAVRDMFIKVLEKWKEAREKAGKGDPKPLELMILDPKYKMESPAFLMPIIGKNKGPKEDSFGRTVAWITELPTDERQALREDLAVGGLVTTREVYQLNMEGLLGPGKYDPSDPMPDTKGVNHEDLAVKQLLSESKEARGQYIALYEVGKVYDVIDKANALYTQREQALAHGKDLPPVYGKLGQKAYKMISPPGQTMMLTPSVETLKSLQQASKQAETGGLGLAALEAAKAYDKKNQSKPSMDMGMFKE